MITLVENSLPLFNTDSVLIGRLSSWWEAYGNHPHLARFYTDQNGSCAAVLDTQAVLVCKTAAAREEFASFFALQPHIKTLYTDVETAKVLALPFSVQSVMKYEGKPADNVLDQASPREIYEVLVAVFADFPPFEPWYLDVSYRMRHNLCHQSSAWENGKLVATAMTVAEWGKGTLLGAVATLPECRRKGYAAHCVMALVSYFVKQGKTAYICPKNENARRLYASLGFVEHEAVAYIERK